MSRSKLELEILEDRIVPAVVNLMVAAVASGPGLMVDGYNGLAAGTPHPDNDNVVFKDNFVSQDVRFAATNYVDIVYTLQDSVGVSEYFMEYNVINLTQQNWGGFVAQVGFGTGAQFSMAPFLAPNGLNMDYYDPVEMPVVRPDGRFTQINKEHSFVSYTDGNQPSGFAGQTAYWFSIDVPNFQVSLFPESAKTADGYLITIRLIPGAAGGGGAIPPDLSINDVSGAETNSGTTPFTFTVTLSNSSAQAVTVDYTVLEGTATLADNDFVAASGTVTFAPFQTSQTITVQVNGDTKYETDETFTVLLSNPTNAAIADNSGTGTITNDDSPPTMAIGDVSQAEGNSGTTNFNFTVSLSAASYQTVTVNYATATGTAGAPGDFTALSGALTFNPGEVTKTVTVSVVGDTTQEANENFTVNLSGAVNATVTDAVGVGTILNDDAVLSINDISRIEGPGASQIYIFTVSLSGASGVPVTLDYSTANGTATAGSDYTAVSGSLTFSPGQLTKTIAVTVFGDLIFEPNETFFIDLTNILGAAALDSQGLGTILNDD